MIAELLHAEGEQSPIPSVENLVTHRSQNFWLSCECPNVRIYVHLCMCPYVHPSRYIFDIAHPCYDLLTAVKTRYPLTSITWPYPGLRSRAH